MCLDEFDASAAGMINSFVARYPRNDVILEDLWRADLPFHSDLN